MTLEFGKVCYLALDHDKAEYYQNSFESKFERKQYDKNNRPKNLYIRKCNFDIDKRGGLKLVLFNSENCAFEQPSRELQYIIDNNINYRLIMSDVKEFIPILAFKRGPSFRYQEGNKIYLNCPNEILNNDYLKYKDKYAIWNGVVEKVKFSHFEVDYFDKNNEEPKIYKYKNYDEIPREYRTKSNIYDIYEIIQEN